MLERWGAAYRVPQGWMRSGSGRLGRRLEHGEVDRAALDPVPCRLAVADGGEFAGQQRAGRAVRPDGAVRVEDRHPAAGAHRRGEVVEEAEGLGDLVVHVDQQREVHGARRQAGVMRLAEDQGDVVEAFAGDTLAEAVEVFALDVLGDDLAVGADAPRQAPDVVAGAGADVGDRHAGADAEQVHDLGRFAGALAAVLVHPLVGNDAGDRALGLREAVRGQAGAGLGRRCRRARARRRSRRRPRPPSPHRRATRRGAACGCTGRAGAPTRNGPPYFPCALPSCDLTTLQTYIPGSGLRWAQAWCWRG